MVFSPYPDFAFSYNSQDLSLSQRLYYPTPLPRTAVLRKPEGNFWTVKWTINQEETISFEDGWSKFVTDDGPIDGDFLLFTYDGSRSFWVRINRNGLVVEPEAPIRIQEIADETGGGDDDDLDHDMETGGDDEDDHHDISITSLSDEDDACEVNKARLRKGKPSGCSQKKRAASIGDPESNLDDRTNPYTIANSSCPRHFLPIDAQAVKDFGLKFGGTINLIDGFGEVKGKVSQWSDRTVVYNWDEIVERNDVKPEDLIICEILREGGIVKSIKAHFARK